MVTAYSARLSPVRRTKKNSRSGGCGGGQYQPILLRPPSGRVGIGGVEERQLEGYGPSEEVAAQIRLGGADPVQLRTQEIDEAAKIRTVVQRNPFGMHEVARRRAWRSGSPVEIEPLGHDEHREC